MSFHKSLSAIFLTISLFNYTNATPLLRRENDLGLHFAPNSGCDNTSIAGVLNAIADTRTLCSAGINAFNSADQRLANYLFPSNLHDMAKSVLNAVTYAIQPVANLPTDPKSNLNPIQLFCTDMDSLCNTPARGNQPGTGTTRWGYARPNANPPPGFGSSNAPAQIVVCPAMFTLPRTPAPCSGSPGTANLGWAFLRTFVTLRSVQGGFDRLGRDAINDNSPGLQGSHQLVVGKGVVEANADSYAQLATWANDLGVGNGTAWQCSQAWTFS